MLLGERGAADRIESGEDRNRGRRRECRGGAANAATAATVTTGNRRAPPLPPLPPLVCALTVVRCAVSAQLSGSDHPHETEAVDHHTEAFAPEGRLPRERYLAAVGKGIEECLADASSSAVSERLKPFMVAAGSQWPSEAIQSVEPDAHIGVHDFFFQTGSRLILRIGRRLLIAHLERDLSAELRAVIVERFLAPAIEKYVRLNDHDRLRKM